MQKGALCPIIKMENFAKYGCKKIIKNMLKEAVICMGSGLSVMLQ